MNGDGNLFRGLFASGLDGLLELAESRRLDLRVFLLNVETDETFSNTLDLSGVLKVKRWKSETR